MTISLIHPVFVFYLVYFGVFRTKYDTMLNLKFKCIKDPLQICLKMYTHLDGNVFS